MGLKLRKGESNPVAKGIMETAIADRLANNPHSFDVHGFIARKEADFTADASESDENDYVSYIARAKAVGLDVADNTGRLEISGLMRNVLMRERNLEILYAAKESKLIEAGDFTELFFTDLGVQTQAANLIKTVELALSGKLEDQNERTYACAVPNSVDLPENLLAEQTESGRTGEFDFATFSEAVWSKVPDDKKYAASHLYRADHVAYLNEARILGLVSEENAASAMRPENFNAIVRLVADVMPEVLIDVRNIRIFSKAFEERVISQQDLAGIVGQDLDTRTYLANVLHSARRVANGDDFESSSRTYLRVMTEEVRAQVMEAHPLGFEPTRLPNGTEFSPGASF